MQTINKNQNNEECSENMDAFCGYRNFKLFIPGEDGVQFLIANSKTFNLRGKYDVWDNNQYELPLQGYWGEDYKLRISARQIKNLGVGIEIIGDFKKLYFNGKEDGVFIWSEFIEAVEKLLTIFSTVAENVHVINLSPSVNIAIPLHWNATAPDIIHNILRFKGKYNHRLDKDSFDKGYHLQFALSEYIYHIKTIHQSTDKNAHQSLVIAMEIKKSAYLKDRDITYLSDLLLHENHKLLLMGLTDLLDHLIIYQHPVDNEILLVEKGVYCWEYNKPQAWNKLHATSIDDYKYYRAQLEKVIAKVCTISYKKELQQLVKEALEKRTSTIIPEAVPDFPLYMEKQGMEHRTTLMPLHTGPSPNYSLA